MIEIVLELFPELVSALRVRDIAITTVLLIQLVRHCETDEFLRLEEQVVLLDKVIHHIGLHHHVLGLIRVVVVLTKTPINPKAMISDLTKLITDLSHQRLILISPHCLSGGGDID